jgi:hypothetical protein
LVDTKLTRLPALFNSPTTSLVYTVNVIVQDFAPVLLGKTFGVFEDSDGRVGVLWLSVDEAEDRIV